MLDLKSTETFYREESVLRWRSPRAAHPVCLAPSMAEVPL